MENARPSDAGRRIRTGRSFRRVVLAHTAGVAVLNAVVNLSYTWWPWREGSPLTLFGPNAVGYDLALTPVWLGVFAVWPGIAMVRKKANGSGVALPAAVHSHFHRLPRTTLPRVAVIGGLMGLAFGVPLWLALHVSRIDTVSLAQACGAKVIITLVLSVVIGMYVGSCIAADLYRERHAS